MPHHYPLETKSGSMKWHNSEETEQMTTTLNVGRMQLGTTRGNLKTERAAMLLMLRAYNN